MSNFRTPIKNARGLGSAKTGTEHFVHQRLTATALVALTIWFLVFVLSLIGADYVKPGAAVIDVGINRTDDGLRGDVDFGAVVERAGLLTPVPGGVGPMTIAMLLRNTLTAAELQRRDG